MNYLVIGQVVFFLDNSYTLLYTVYNRRGNMVIIINNSSMQPIYDQIVEQIKTVILEEKMLEGEMLPSVRALSKDLKISALTVKKAYDTLEKDGFIITVHGKGSYVKGVNPSLLLEEIRKDVEQSMEKIIVKAHLNGITNEEMEEIFHLLLEEMK